jgi:hypothetical protein
MRTGLVASGVLATCLAACAARPLFPSLAVEIDAGSGTDAGADAGLDAGPAPGAVDWGIVVGPAAPTGGSTTVTAVVPLSDGSVIVAGGFVGTVSFAPDVTQIASAPRGAYVARYRSDQRLVWVTTFGAPAGDVEIADLAPLDGGEVAVAGWFGATLTIADTGGDSAGATLTSAGGLDLFVARLASDGSLRWSKRAGGPDDDIARGVASRIDASGSVAVALTGASGPGAIFGAGESGQVQAPAGDGPIFVGELDGADGSNLWTAFPGGQIPGQGYAVAIDGSGRVGVTGYVNGPAPFGDGPDGAPVVVDPARGRAFVGAWSAGGALLWALPLGGAMGEGDALVDAAAGGFAVAGLFQGTATFASGGGAPSTTLVSDSAGQPGCFLATVGADGSLAVGAVRRLAGSGLHPWRLRRDLQGGLLLAASYGGRVEIDPDGPHPAITTSRGDDDAVFVRLAQGGALSWATTGGGLGDDEGADLAAAFDGSFWAAGRYAGPATFGAGVVTLDSGTGGGGFLLHLDP